MSETRLFASNKDSGNFSGEYKKTGFFQAGYNEIFLDSIVSYIQQHFAERLANSPDQDLEIIDIGSGSGNCTRSLQKKLKLKGFKANITGTDISQAQIAEAKKFENEKLHFKVEAVEALKDKNKYDLVISLFSYHWFQNKDQVAKQIKESLKADGIFFALIPLEKPRLFALRQANVQFWKPYLENLQLNPLVEDPNFYAQIFSTQFPQMQNQYKRNEHLFSKKLFEDFIKSWGAEGRCTVSKTRSKRKHDALTPEQTQQMMCDLTDSIPEDKNEDVHAEMYEGEKRIRLGERIVTFACSSQPLQFTLEAPSVEDKEGDAEMQNTNQIRCFF